MTLATPETVLGDFKSREFTHHGVTTRFERKKDTFYVTTAGPEGTPETYEVKYTFGIHPLQQYMVEMPDGRVQVLDVAWDTNKNEWFDPHPHEQSTSDDWSHWTNAGSNWNSQCAACHSTNVEKGYHAKDDTYRTSFSDINVSCEACHGPGSIHVQLANSYSLFWDRELGYGLVDLSKSSSQTQIDTCAQCHSRRQLVYANYRPGESLLDNYEPDLLVNDAYYVDGQMLAEGYEYGSFLQSRMHRENVRCTDCHDPHSTKLKLEGNQLCLQCHTPSKGNYDSPSHHHHQMGTAGASCVACHMPTHTYMGIDIRHDHSLRVPRPDLSVKLGVPNACQECHTKPEETPQWATDKIVEWYGPQRRDDPHYGEILAAGRARQSDAVPKLIALAQQTGNPDQAKNTSDIVRASALALLGNYPSSPESQQALESALHDLNPLVRSAAVKALNPRQRLHGAEAKHLHDLLLPLLNDPIRGVRFEAAQMLTLIPQPTFSRPDFRQFTNVLDEWKASLEKQSDDAAAALMLATLSNNSGDFGAARNYYQEAMNRRPSPQQAIQARMDLAALESLEGRDSEAERLYREIVVLKEKNLARLKSSLETTPLPEKLVLEHTVHEQEHSLADTYYALAELLKDDDQRMAEASEQLAQAVKLKPDDASLRLTYANTLRNARQFERAENEYLDLRKQDPDSLEYMYELANLYLELERYQEALELAKELSRRDARYEPLLRKALKQKLTVGPRSP